MLITKFSQIAAAILGKYHFTAYIIHCVFINQLKLSRAAPISFNILKCALK